MDRLLGYSRLVQGGQVLRTEVTRVDIFFSDGILAEFVLICFLLDGASL